MNISPQKETSQRLAPAMVVVLSGLYLVLLGAACSGKEPLITSVPSTDPIDQSATSEPHIDEASWIMLDDSFENSAQVEAGAEIYRLVCSACHGDVGQGLTKEWLATWAPEDRNCWQSKCHGEIHPPDGFELPRYSPPVKGPILSALFDTALDLYKYNKQSMPWHAPGTMRDEEYWQVTAFLLDLNEFDLGDTVLDENTAAGIILKNQ